LVHYRREGRLYVSFERRTERGVLRKTSMKGRSRNRRQHKNFIERRGTSSHSFSGGEKERRSPEHRDKWGEGKII